MMFQTLADLTPIMIGLVGIGQVGVVAWGIRVMRDAGRERSEQMQVLLESVREAVVGLREASNGIRELLDRPSAEDMTQADTSDD